MTRREERITINLGPHGRWFVQLVPERLRWAHRWYAQTHGYFWLPCVLCGRESGGHEWRDIDGKESSIPDPTEGPGRSIGICPWCTRESRGWSDGTTAGVGFVIRYDTDKGTT